MNRALANMKNPIKRMKPKSSHTFSSSSSSSSSSPDSSSDETSSPDTDEDLIYYCRFCNKKNKGKRDRKPEEEVCHHCLEAFPEKMYCKSCRRFFPDRKPFTKAKDRCNFCFEKLEKAREARKRKKEGDQLNQEDKTKKKEESACKKIKKREEGCVYLEINGKRIFKKNFAF